MELNVEETNIKGVKIIHYDNFIDIRGYIWTTYNEKEFRIQANFVMTISTSKMLLEGYIMTKKLQN